MGIKFEYTVLGTPQQNGIVEQAFPMLMGRARAWLNQSGFDKLGFSGGLQSWIYLSHKMDLSVDLLFSQRGSKPGNTKNYENINYLTLPLYIR